MHGYIFYSLILLNIIIYTIILTNIFLLFFLHDTRFFKTVNEFKNVFTNNYYVYVIVLCILSMAGMPPLLGFFGKFFIIIFFLKLNHFLLFFIFVIFNIFVIYFYILNLKFVITKNNRHFFFLKKNLVYINFNVISLLLFFTLLNFFAIFFMNDLILYINCLCSFNF